MCNITLKFDSNDFVLLVDFICTAVYHNWQELILNDENKCNRMKILTVLLLYLKRSCLYKSLW